jgi:1-acyl-sn-glycerol-3-phosphate acyltransferase
MILFMRSLLFNIIFFIWMIGISVGCFLGGLIKGYRGVNAVAACGGRVVNWFLRILLNINFEMRGQENVPKDGKFLVACKHQSTWETMFLHNIVQDSTVIVKKELTYIPFFGQALYLAGSICIDRTRGKKLIPQMVEGAKRSLEKGRPLFIFPEGTRSVAGQAGKYRLGICALYQALEVPVLPIALNSGYFWPRHGFLKKPGTIILEILPLIMPGLPGDVFMKTLENTIENATLKLAPPPRDVK